MLQPATRSMERKPRLRPGVARLRVGSTNPTLHLLDADLRAVVKTKKTGHLFTAMFVKLLKPGSRAALWVSQLIEVVAPGPNETANYELPFPFETTPQPTFNIRKRDRECAERVRLAGGPKQTLRERAVRLALEKGEVRTKDLTDIGVPRCYLARLCEEGLLVKVRYGRYRAAVPKAA